MIFAVGGLILSLTAIAILVAAYFHIPDDGDNEQPGEEP